MPEANEEFRGLVAVVTGAAQGIGRAIAEDLRARGARLVLVDCNATALVETATSIWASSGATVDLLVADLGDPVAIESLANDVAALATQVDVLVNNAGIEMDLPFSQITASVFDRVIAVNLRAPLLMSQALAPLFPLSGGAIVNISSIHASHAFPNAIPYACSKAGLLALTRNLALELGPRRIRVNAICPGYIDTAMWDEWLRSAPDAETVAAATTTLHPLGSRGLPRDVAPQ